MPKMLKQFIHLFVLNDVAETTGCDLNTLNAVKKSKLFTKQL